MSNKLISILQRTSELLYHGKNIPQARYSKLMNELKSKIKETMNDTDTFEEKYSSYLDFKTNYIKLAYPKSVVSEEESICILTYRTVYTIICKIIHRDH